MATQFSRYNRRGRLDLQNLPEGTDTAPTEDLTGLGDTADSLETDLVELVAEDQAQQGDDANIEQAVADIDTLGQYADQLEDPEQEITPEVAGAINTGLESIDRRYVFRKARRLSKEDFGDTNTQQHARKLGLENVKERAVQLRDWIITKFKELIEWLVAQWNKYFDAATKLEARIKKVTESLGDKKFDGGKEIESANVATGLQLVGQVKELTTEMAGKQLELITDSATATSSSLDFLSNNIPSDDLSNEKLTAFLEGLAKAGSAASKGLKPVGGEELEKVGVSGYKSGFITDELPGGIFAYIAYTADGKVGAGEAKSTQQTDKKTVKTVSSETAKGVLEKLSAIVTQLLEGRKLVKKVDTETKSIAKKLEALLNTYSKKPDGEEGVKQSLDIIVKLAESARKVAAEPFNTLLKYEVRFTKVALDLVELSIKEGGAATAPAGDAGDGDKK